MLKSKDLLFTLTVLVLGACLLLSACSSLTAVPTSLPTGVEATKGVTMATPSIPPAASETPTPSQVPSPTLAPLKSIPLSQVSFNSSEIPPPAATLIPESEEMLDGHEVILRIQNVDKLTGRADQPTRWLAWGSPAFTFSSDGSIWIVDVSNRQTRLAHISSQGELLEILPLEGLIHIMDVAADQQHVWLLGDNPEWRHTLFLFDLSDRKSWQAVLPDEFQMITSPQGGVDDWSLTGLALDEQGELYLERLGGAEFIKVIHREDELIFEPVPGYPSAGHIYRFESGENGLNRGPMRIDDRTVDVVDPTSDDTIFFQGSAPDGSFYMLYRLGDQRYLRHYSQDGELVGFARPPKGFRSLQYDSDLYESDTAVSPDGDLFALVSLEDQDVVILRLSFTDGLSQLPSPTPYIKPTPMTILRPAWETPPPGTQAEEIARETLIAFFSLLADRQYAQAAELYGGGLEAFEPRFVQAARSSPQSEARVREYLTSLEDDPEQFWQSACSTLLACLSLGNISEVEQLSETEFRFWVELTWEDGFKYITNACCGGNPAITPFVWLFPYTVREVDGRFQVFEPPPLLE